ncbi:MAG: FecR domain-containing protein [Flavitalea sp.]
MQQQELIGLLKKQMSDQLSPADRTALMAFITLQENKTAVTKALETMMMGHSGDKAFDDERFRPLLRQILDADHASLEEDLPFIPNNAVSRSFSGYRWFRYAAAVLLIFGIGAAVFMYTKPAPLDISKQQPAPVKQAPVAPGTNKAMLTLSNGQQVELTEGNGTVNDAGVNIKKINGALIYGSANSASIAVAYNTMTTPRGGQYQLTLPDGTKVWLNAASSLRYPTMFTGKERKVTVTGEAYFEVAKNAGMPFTVVSGNQEITVLGTHFNNNAYEDEASMKTTLLEGSVKVKHGASVVTIVPGQQSIIQEGVGDILVSETDIQQAVAWKNGFFSFSNADIKTIMRQLSRWYNVDVIYESNVPKVEFSGEIGRSLTLDELLGILKDTRIHYRIEGRKLVIMP